MDDDFPFHLASLERAFVYITVLFGQFPDTVLQVVLPFSYVLVSVGPRDVALSVLGSFHEVTHVFVAIGIFEDAEPRAVSVHVVAFIDIAGFEFVNTLAVLDVVFPFAAIHVAIRVEKSAFSAALVLRPLPVIGSAVSPVEEALAFLHVVLPLAFVVGSIGVSICALALSLVLIPVAVVLVSIIIIHHAVTLLVVAEPKANILVVVHEIERSLAVLLVLKPLAFILLPIREGVDPIALASSFHVFSLVDVTVLVSRAAFPLGLSARHFSLVFAAILCDA